MGKLAQSDEDALVNALKVCTRSKDLTWGKRIHAYMITSRIKPSVFIMNILVDMYAKCGSLQDARVVFDHIHKQDVVSWNIMISGHAKHGDPEEAFKLFNQMESVGLLPDRITFLGILDACASSGNLRQGVQIHIRIVFSGLKPNITTANALINMYSKCSSMGQACKIFNRLHDRDVISWNTILSGFIMHKDVGNVLGLFEKMERDSVKPDEVSFLSILNACASLGDLEQGKQAHAKMIQAGLKTDIVMENALLDMYTKCGSIEIASQIFNEMTNRNVVSWTVMITTHADLGNVVDVFNLFQQMQCEGVNPNDVTFLSILCACGSLGDLEKGKRIHTNIVGSAWEAVVNVGNAVVDMYAKCGSITEAGRCFDKMKIRDVVSWNVMVSGYAQHGHGKEVLHLVEQMKKEGFKPNPVTLVGTLCACSHAGLVAEGFSYFDCMGRHHGIIPTANHYACMVDLLCRSGLLEMADDFFRNIPDEPNLASWRTLLGACKIHGDVKRAKSIAKSTLQLEQGNAPALEMLSNMHAFFAK